MKIKQIEKLNKVKSRLGIHENNSTISASLCSVIEVDNKLIDKLNECIDVINQLVKENGGQTKPLCRACIQEDRGIAGMYQHTFENNCGARPIINSLQQKKDGK